MTTFEFKTSAELAAFINRTKGKFALQVSGADEWFEIFAEKSDLVTQMMNYKGDPEFFIIKRNNENHHVLVKVDRLTW